MKTFIGTGTGVAKKAVGEAAEGLSDPSMILFITSYDSMKDTAELLKKKYHNTPVIGTIGTNLVNGSVEDARLVVLGLYEDVEVRCGVITDLSSFPVESVRELEQNVQEVSPGSENTVCVEYCTNDEEKLVTTINAVLEKNRVPLAGGSTFGMPDGKAGIVSFNGVVYDDACVYAIIKNKSGRIKVFKENIYHKSSSIPHYATKVEEGGKELIELDGKPASRVYSEELGIPQDKIIENVFQNPMGRIVGDEVYISSMKELLPNGDIVNYKRINQNDCIYFLELGDYRRIEDETRHRITQELNHISLVISIDCIYRYLLYTQNQYFDEYVSQMAMLGPHIGVIGGGEQFNNQHVNQTMVCAVFE